MGDHSVRPQSLQLAQAPFVGRRNPPPRPRWSREWKPVASRPNAYSPRHAGRRSSRSTARACCTRRRPPTPRLQVGVRTSLPGAALGHHVAEQLLDLAACWIPRPTCRTAGEWPPRPLREATRHSRNAIGHPGQPFGDHPPIVLGVSGIRSNTSRIDCSGDAITFNSPTRGPHRATRAGLRVAPHRGECHDVDVVLGRDAIELTQCAAGGIGTRRHTVGGVVR